MLILEYMRKYCFLEKVSVSPRHVQSSVSLWNTVNFQYSTITMGDKHRRIFYRADFPDKTQIFDPDQSTVLICLTALLENHKAMP